MSNQMPNKRRKFDPSKMNTGILIKSDSTMAKISGGSRCLTKDIVDVIHCDCNLCAIKGEEQIRIITLSSFFVSGQKIATQHSRVADDVSSCHESLLCVAESMRSMLTNFIQNFEKHPSQHFTNFVASSRSRHLSIVLAPSILGTTQSIS